MTAQSTRMKHSQIKEGKNGKSEQPTTAPS